MTEWYGIPTRGEIRQEEDEEKYNSARLKFFREELDDPATFKRLMNATPIADYLDAHYHEELREIYYDIVDPDPLDP